MVLELGVRGAKKGQGKRENKEKETKLLWVEGAERLEGGEGNRKTGRSKVYQVQVQSPYDEHGHCVSKMYQEHQGKTVGS